MSPTPPVSQGPFQSLSPWGPSTPSGSQLSVPPSVSMSPLGSPCPLQDPPYSLSPRRCPCPHQGPPPPLVTPPVSLSPLGSPSTPCHPHQCPCPHQRPSCPPSLSPWGSPVPPPASPSPSGSLLPPPQFLSPVPILPPPVSPSPPPHTRLLRHLPRRPVLATVALGGRPLLPPCHPRLLLTFAGAALGLHPWGEGQRGRGGGTSVCPVSP